MDWLETQAKKTRLARLLAATPEFVFSELATYGERARKSYEKDEGLEKSLLARDEPLIDLGLACHATSRELVFELYQRARGTHYANPEFRKGIILGCLSNQRDFFNRLYSSENSRDPEFVRLVTEGEEDELHVLFSNPTIDPYLLADLFRRKAPFDCLPEQRWFRLIVLARDNERINDEQDTSDSPDLGHYNIHEAIFELLETAPTTGQWVHNLYWLLLDINPSHAAFVDPDRLKAVVARWNGVEVKDYKGVIEEGYGTSLPFIDEFRCLIATLYARSQAKDGPPFADFASNDITRRCAYYRTATLKESDVTQAAQKDKEVFAYFVLSNTGALLNSKTRALIEESGSGAEFALLYKQRCEQIQKRYPTFDPRPTSEWLIDSEEKPDPLAQLRQQITAIGTELATVRRAMDTRLGWISFVLVVIAGFLIWKFR